MYYFRYKIYITIQNINFKKMDSSNRLFDVLLNFFQIFPNFFRNSREDSRFSTTKINS